MQLVVYISLICIMKYIFQFNHRVIKLLSKKVFQLQIPIKECLSSNFRGNFQRKSTYPHLVTGWHRLAAPNVIFMTIINNHDFTDDKELSIHYPI